MWIILAIVIAAGLVFIFLPQFKGYRTVVKEAVIAAIGVLVPLLSQITGSLEGLDWRTYVLAGDRKNLTVLAILAILAIVGTILRYKTTGPVGSKE